MKFWRILCCNLSLAPPSQHLWSYRHADFPHHQTMMSKKCSSLRYFTTYLNEGNLTNYTRGPLLINFYLQWRIFHLLEIVEGLFLLRFLSATPIPLGIIIAWISDARAPRDLIFAETCAVHCKSLRGIIWYYAVASRREIGSCDFYLHRFTTDRGDDV